MKEEKNETSTEVLIENVRRANKSLVRRQILLITFGVISIGAFFAFKKVSDDYNNFITSRRVLRIVSHAESPTNSLCCNTDIAHLVPVLERQLEWEDYSLRFFEDSANVQQLLDSADIILDRQFEEKYSKPSEFGQISVLGISIDHGIWSSLAPLLITLVFFNFNALLRYRDILLNTLIERKISSEEIGPELYEIYSPYDEYKKSVLPSFSALIFTIFLMFVFYVLLIAPIPVEVANIPFDGLKGFTNVISVLCILAVTIQICLISMRQNLLGFKTLFDGLLGGEYFNLEKNQKIPRKRVFFWFIPSVFVNLLVWVVILGDLVFHSDTSSIVLVFIGFLIGTTILPIGLMLYRKKKRVAFEAMMITGAIMHVYAIVFVVFGLSYFPHKSTYIQGVFIVGLIIATYLISVYYIVMRKEKQKGDSVLLFFNDGYQPPEPKESV